MPGEKQRALERLSGESFLYLRSMKADDDRYGEEKDSGSSRKPREGSGRQSGPSPASYAEGKAEERFHPFDSSILSFPLPRQFTNPFHYTPHPLAVKAAEEVQTYLQTRKEWVKELEEGKMFGVLVVRGPAGEIGFLAAFSGILAGKNLHRYFVPPVYDLQQPDSFFGSEEEQISLLNARIRTLEADPGGEELRRRVESLRLRAKQSLDEEKARMEAARLRREEIRRCNPGEAEIAALIRESQFQKAEFRRSKRIWTDRIAAAQTEAAAWENRIATLKAERKRRSAALQQRLFGQFRFRNARGEIRDLPDLFRETAGKVPPAGAGECAAPKLLQYAYGHGFLPIAMAEFWWGGSPKTEIRREGYFYPACQGKCAPILKHMLQGLAVEADPMASNSPSALALDILFEDEWLLVVNKPAGLLSVPGKTAADSVYSWVKARYPSATGPLIVHRLDMATSGLLLIAKTKAVHQHLQAQFKNRTVKKRYIALVEGVVAPEQGNISLPLCPDPLDRPRQMVHPVYGKPALTRYGVVDRLPGGRTRIAFYPLTGRTHQLRVHASHPAGLNTPIVGDELYGRRADRLYLHAEYLEFVHPASGEKVKVEKPADF